MTAGVRQRPPGDSREPGRPGLLLDASRIGLAQPRARLGVAIVALVALAAVIGPFLVDWEVGKMDLAALSANRHQALPPLSANHLLGTDVLGRDQLARILVGMRSSILVALVAQAVVVAVGVPIGAVAGWMGGWAETGLMRFTDVIAAFPQLVFIIMIRVPFLDTPVHRWLDGLFVIVVAIGLLSWVTVARVLRGEVLSVKRREFVEAARATGVRGSRILARHVLPNVVGSVLVAVSAGIPAVILAESTLSFLGLGIQPPSPSLGGMIADGAKYLQRYPHLIMVPVVPLVVLLIGFTLLGDGLRDALNPRLRRRRG
jgi:oligopeptide transport system permease protein